MRPSTLTLVALLCAGSLATPAESAKPRKDRSVDHIVVHPDLRSLRISAVAMLPAASYEGNDPAERNAEAELMRSIRDAGFRWITAPTTREMLRRSGGDSLLKVVRESVLSRDVIDSTLVPGVCARLRVNGLITVRVERAEQISIQSDQSGRPSTTLQLRAVLVDSLGTLAWSASGAESVNGMELQADAGGAVGGGSGSLGPSAIQQRHNAPEWTQVLAPLLVRWAPTFPKRSAMAGGAPADSTGR